MSRNTWMETITVVDVAAAELDIENIDKICIGQAAVALIFLQNIPQYGIVYIPNLRMECFSTTAIGTVSIIYRIRI